MTERPCTDFLFYVPSFFGGGAERNCVLLANELAARGSHVSIVVDHESGPNREMLSSKVSLEVLGGRSHLADILALRIILRAHTPRQAFVQLGLSPFKFVVSSLGLSHKSHAVLIYHGLYDAHSALGSRFTYWLAPLLGVLFQSVVAVSNDLRAQLVERFRSPRSAKVIYNPVDIDLVSFKSLEGNGFNLRRRYLLSAGRMTHHKDFATLIRAFASISGQIVQDLVILGEGPLRQSLVELARELGISHRVSMPGYLNNPFPTFRTADVFILSSTQEAFGNVLVEALALSVQVISTNCPGGPKEILNHGEYGQLVPVGDEKALADAILTTLTNPLPAELLRSRALDYAVSKIADRYIELCASPDAN